MKKPFTTMTIVVLALIVLAHALRIMLGWKVAIAGTHVPMWVSIVTLIVAAGLAFLTWQENYVRRKISSSQGQPKSISARVLLPCSTKLLGHVAHDAVLGNLGIRLVDSGELFGGDRDELLRHAASHQLVGMVVHY